MRISDASILVRGRLDLGRIELHRHLPVKNIDHGAHDALALDLDNLPIEAAERVAEALAGADAQPRADGKALLRRLLLRLGSTSSKAPRRCASMDPLTAARGIGVSLPSS